MAKESKDNKKDQNQGKTLITLIYFNYTRPTRKK
jgi:hypothetical protein